MGERRLSGWFVLSAVFIVLVFGLFFTFTERKSWPEHRIELGPMDMRLVPPVSTLWCEAMSLHSDHSFVAYQVNGGTRISSKRLNLQKVNLQVKLGGSWNTNSIKLKYFLLPSSVIQIVACSSSPGVKLMIFKGDLDVHNCLQSLVFGKDSSAYDSDEDSSEEDIQGFNYDSDYSAEDIMGLRKFCSALITYRSVDTSYMDNYSVDCNPYTELYPVRVNVSSADSYVIVLWNTNRQVTNHVGLQVLLDRARYTVHRSGQPLDLCSLSNSCTIGLGFASEDRVLVSIPDEPNAGRSSFVVRSRCKPRLAVFAVLSVLLPLILFLIVASVVRTDKSAFIRFCYKRRESDSLQSNRQRIATPLLDDQNTACFDTPPANTERTEIESIQNDEMPPPYHTLYDPPPPYACVKGIDRKNGQTT